MKGVIRSLAHLDVVKLRQVPFKDERMGPFPPNILALRQKCFSLFVSNVLELSQEGLGEGERFVQTSLEPGNRSRDPLLPPGTKVAAMRGFIHPRNLLLAVKVGGLGMV